MNFCFDFQEKSVLVIAAAGGIGKKSPGLLGVVARKFWPWI